MRTEWRGDGCVLDRNALRQFGVVGVVADHDAEGQFGPHEIRGFRTNAIYRSLYSGMNLLVRVGDSALSIYGNDIVRRTVITEFREANTGSDCVACQWLENCTSCRSFVRIASRPRVVPESCQSPDLEAPLGSKARRRHSSCTHGRTVACGRWIPWEFQEFLGEQRPLLERQPSSV